MQQALRHFSQRKKLFTLCMTGFASLAAVITSLGVFGPATSSALSGSDFEAGRIIDDDVFFNDSTMSVSRIQAFLNAKVPVCDTNHAETNSPNDSGRPYICLKDYKQKISSINNSNEDYCTGDISGGTKTAAQIIHAVAKACDVNPKVLIVLLQKEQSLITDVWPWDIQYRSATGYGCPDTAPCDSEFYGFFNQVYQAAKAYRRYAANPHDYNYRHSRTNSILYHPNAACGSSNVFIKNQATAGLYIYTPYRPNQAALNNLYGTGNSCSAYGNRNFWRLYSDWFGSTRSNIDFKEMEKPRWMKLKEDTQKVHQFTGQELGDPLVAGQEIFFKDKIKFNGVTYLRTRHDTNQELDRAIPLSLLEEVPLDFTTMKTPRWLQTQQEMHKIDPITEKPTGEKIPSGTVIYFSTLTKIGGKMYLRTTADEHHGNRLGVPYTELSTTTLDYTAFENSRWMIANTVTRSYNLKYPSGSVSPSIPAGTELLLDHKTTLNNHTYVTEGLPVVGEYVGINLNHLRGVEPRDFRSLKYQRAYKLLDTTQKTDLASGQAAEAVTIDEPVYFQTLIKLGDAYFLRSAHDTQHNRTTVIPLDALEPIEVVFEAMLEPRRLNARTPLRKVDPVTLKKVDDVIEKNRSIAFAEKIVINGEMYLRTLQDAQKGHFRVIPLSALAER